MQRLGLYMMFCGAFGLVLSCTLPAAAPPQHRSATFDDVTCNTISCNAIELISKDGKHRVNVYAQEDCVGVCVSGPTGRVQMYSGKYQGAWLGVDAHSQDMAGCAFAVGTGDVIHGQEPFLQLVAPQGKVRFASVKDIMKLLEKEK